MFLGGQQFHVLNVICEKGILNSFNFWLGRVRSLKSKYSWVDPFKETWKSLEENLSEDCVGLMDWIKCYKATLLGNANNDFPSFLEPRYPTLQHQLYHEIFA